VLADPAPHWVLHPAVVGVTVAVFCASPIAAAAPLTVNTTLSPLGMLTDPEIAFPAFVAVHVAIPAGVQVTVPTDTDAGAVSAMMAVPGPPPVLVTVIVYVTGWPTM
jgi:hypothetical protein